MPQTSAFAGLAAGEDAARPAMTCEHRVRGVGLSLGRCCTFQATERVLDTLSAPPQHLPHTYV
eukprot:4426913-Prymnesium_polylepis.2